jgi:hypothetical protein
MRALVLPQGKVHAEACNAIKRERGREGETEATTNEIDGGSRRWRVTRAGEWLKRSERDPGTVTLAASGTYFCCDGWAGSMIRYALIRSDQGLGNGLS